MKANDIKTLQQLAEKLSAELPHGNPPDELQVLSSQFAHALGYHTWDNEALKKFESYLENRNRRKR